MSSESRHYLIDLARRAMAGDDPARRELIQRFYRIISQQIQQVGHSWTGPNSGSDLAQDTVAQAWTDLPQFWGETDPQLVAWLNRILRNNFNDMMQALYAAKRDCRRERQMTETEGGRIPTREAAPEELAERTELYESIRHLVAQLPERYRVAIQMWSDGAPYEALGHHLRCSPPAARHFCRRALARIRSAAIAAGQIDP